MNKKIIIGLVFILIAGFLYTNTYTSSPGLTSQEYAQEFHSKKPDCQGYDILLNREATYGDAPGISICLGMLKYPKNINSENTSNNVSLINPQFSWKLTYIGTDTEPKNKIELVVSADNAQPKTLEVATVNLSCNEQEDGDKLPPNIAYKKIISCWFAGGGQDFIVVNDNGKYIVQVRDVDEESGIFEFKSVTGISL